MPVNTTGSLEVLWFSLKEEFTLFSLFSQNHLKDILTSVVSRRKAYRLRDGHFKYAFGSNVTPQPYLKNSVVAYNNLIERYRSFLGLAPVFLGVTVPATARRHALGPRASEREAPLRAAVSLLRSAPSRDTQRVLWALLMAEGTPQRSAAACGLPRCPHPLRWNGVAPAGGTAALLTDRGPGVARRAGPGRAVPGGGVAASLPALVTFRSCRWRGRPVLGAGSSLLAPCCAHRPGPLSRPLSPCVTRRAFPTRRLCPPLPPVLSPPKTYVQILSLWGRKILLFSW